MKKLIVIGLFVIAAFLGGRGFQHSATCAASRGGQAPAQENGDCNGDGEQDLTDAIYLLSFLFQGGPPPVAFAQTGGLTPEQEEILGHMSMVDLPTSLGSPPARTIRLTGVNLQIVNGDGSTFSSNGSGNLIIGYQEVEDEPTAPNFRTGSHNVVVGSGHNYSSYGGLVVGRRNTVTGEFSSVTSGSSNTVSAAGASVSGGFNNTADGVFSSVSGGSRNRAAGMFSSVLGGFVNTASGQNSAVAGGQGNDAQGSSAAVSGGGSNTATGNLSTVSGGESRSAVGELNWSAGSLHEER